jgi:putative photosynthetic complex assembly protein 2
MTTLAWPLLFTLLIWWGSTGLLLFLATRTALVLGSMLLMSGVCVAAWMGLLAAADSPTVTGAYLSFSCGLLIWGWIELSYLTGTLTGPADAQVPCPAELRGWRRFFLAIRTSLWHELAVVATGVALVALTWDAPNRVGAEAFLVLWIMRWSAKLNLFLGVPNLNVEFFPPHLRFLESWITRKPMNALFPISVTGATLVFAFVVRAALSAESDFDRVGEVCVATLLALAVLEHWFLVLPLNDAALWRWALPGRESSGASPAEQDARHRPGAPGGPLAANANMDVLRDPG